MSRRPIDLSRFSSNLTDRLAPTAAAHPRLADLATSCPALLVAIACPGEDARDTDCAQAARRLIIAGRPLAEACAAAQIPFWLRRARPETFRARPPRLPDTPQFRRAIANHIPAGAGAFERGHEPWRWLDAVAAAFEAGDETVASWAGRAALGKRWMHPSEVRTVAFWAWNSRHAPRRVEGRGWSPDLGWDRAFELADEWKARRASELFGGPPDWARTQAEQDGFAFTPLLDVETIQAEAKAMENCIASYSFAVARGASALWRVAKDGEHVATLEIGPVCEADYVAAREMYGRRNSPASREAWRAAVIFALGRADAAGANSRPPADWHEKQRVWHALLEPYWAAKGGPRAWAPAEADAGSFAA